MYCIRIGVGNNPYNSHAILDIVFQLVRFHSRNTSDNHHLHQHRNTHTLQNNAHRILSMFLYHDELLHYNSLKASAYRQVHSS